MTGEGALRRSPDVDETALFQRAKNTKEAEKRRSISE